MSSKLVLIMVGMLVVLGIAGCSGINEDSGSADQRLYSVKKLMKLDAAKVKAIQVVYGDGTRMVLDQEQDIEPIMKRVDTLQAKRMAGNEESGFLFFMDVVQGEQQIRVASEFQVDGESYILTGPELPELNAYMVELGRSHNPELLPGLTFNE
ncbi:hypothetical protein SAMN04488688_103315 [Paenibacillus sp. cl141a]|uniref:hypothetical protein n=1 Tax=Paenibacillus sp. cl141a TaxID=1761877 RepID=UPI0008B0AB3C|nr:hypothetical protein [Paenibacillus sp. cl141a]SEL26234.1 hypothetical protein SAMN04488688_103315 [Paenibacillus sp. cl141a]